MMGQRLATGHRGLRIRGEGALARSAASRGTQRLRRCGARSWLSTILWRYDGEPSGEWSNMIRLEASGQGDAPIGLLG
jgi:hypothetical protein